MCLVSNVEKYASQNVLSDQKRKEKKKALRCNFVSTLLSVDI